MQAGLKLFDLSIQRPSADGRNLVAGSARQGEKSSSDQLTGFMEIMGALMTLPPEQWKNSLPDLDAIKLDCDAESFSSFIESTHEDAEASEIVQLLMNLNGSAAQDLQDIDAQDKVSLFMDVAKAFMTSQGQFATGSASGGMEDWKAKWLQSGERNDLMPAAPDGSRNQISNVPFADPSVKNQAAQIQAGALQSEMLASEFSTDLGKANETYKTPLQADSNNESGPGSNDNLLLKPAPAETFAKDLSQPFSQFKGGLTKDAGPLANEAKGQGNSVDKQPSGVEFLKPMAADKSAAAQFQSLSAADHPEMKIDGQSVADGIDLEAHSSHKASDPSGEFHGLLSRIDPRQDQTAVPAGGGREVFQADKEMQSDIIRQIVQRMSMHTQGSQSKMVIRLQPEILGDVQMHVLTENHQVTVKMMTDSLAVKEIVEQNLQHLRADLQQHGLQIHKFDVFVANDEQGWKRGQDQSGFRNALQRRQQRADGIKAERHSAKGVSDVGHPQRSIQNNLNEIDYFA